MDGKYEPIGAGLAQLAAQVQAHPMARWQAERRSARAAHLARIAAAPGAVWHPNLTPNGRDYSADEKRAMRRTGAAVKGRRLIRPTTLRTDSLRRLAAWADRGVLTTGEAAALLVDHLAPIPPMMAEALAWERHERTGDGRRIAATEGGWDTEQTEAEHWLRTTWQAKRPTAAERNESARYTPVPRALLAPRAEARAEANRERHQAAHAAALAKVSDPCEAAALALAQAEALFSVQRYWQALEWAPATEAPGVRLAPAERRRLAAFRHAQGLERVEWLRQVELAERRLTAQAQRVRTLTTWREATPGKRQGASIDSAGTRSAAQRASAIDQAQRDQGASQCRAPDGAWQSCEDLARFDRFTRGATWRRGAWHLAQAERVEAKVEAKAERTKLRDRGAKDQALLARVAGLAQRIGAAVPDAVASDPVGAVRWVLGSHREALAPAERSGLARALVAAERRSA